MRFPCNDGRSREPRFISFAGKWAIGRIEPSSHPAEPKHNEIVHGGKICPSSIAGGCKVDDSASISNSNAVNCHLGPMAITSSSTAKDCWLDCQAKIKNRAVVTGKTTMGECAIIDGAHVADCCVANLTLPSGLIIGLKTMFTLQSLASFLGIALRFCWPRNWRMILSMILTSSLRMEIHSLGAMILLKVHKPTLHHGLLYILALLSTDPGALCSITIEATCTLAIKSSTIICSYQTLHTTMNTGLLWTGCKEFGVEVECRPAYTNVLIATQMSLHRGRLSQAWPSPSSCSTPCHNVCTL